MTKRRRNKPKTDSPFQPPTARPSRWQALWVAWLTALFVAAPLIPSESAAAEGTGIVLVMLWLVLLAAWATAGALLGTLTVRAGATSAMLAVFLVLHTIAAVLAVRDGEARPALNMLWQWLSFGAAFFLARQLLVSHEQRRAMAAVMVGLAVCLSTHGLFQYAYSMPQTRAAYARNPDAELAKAGIVAPLGSPARKHFEDRLASTEPIATFALTNSLAGFLSPWLLVALGAAATNWDQRPLRWRLAAAAGLSVALIGICWVLTKSRTAWLATMLGFAVLAVYGRRSGWRPDWRWVAGPIVGGVLLLLAALVVGGIDWLVLTESAKSVQYRFEFWEATAAMVAEHPWWGCGPGNFKASYTGFKLPQASETIAEPHNFLFEIWATAGTPALLALLGVLGAFAWQVRRGGADAGGAKGEPASQRSAKPISAQADVAAEQQAREHENAATAWPVYGGGLAGVLLAFFPCGLLVGYLPDPAVLLGVPVAAVAVGLWHAWVRAGRLPLALLVSALVVLLVNLLAAGGVSYAGVGLTLWLLLALALNGVEHPRAPRQLPRPVAAGLAVAALAIVVLCHLTAYEPILSSAARMSEGRLAQQQFRPQMAERAFLAAAEADPYAAEPWTALANLRFDGWRTTGDPRLKDQFLAAAERMMQAEPRSSVVRQQLGDWSLDAYRGTNEREWLERAIDAYREAVELYPNHNFGHAQLAWALHLAGDSDAASHTAADALRLDAQNPHGELKLARRQLHDPGPSQFPSQPPGPGADGEQVMRKLRIDEVAP